MKSSHYSANSYDLHQNIVTFLGDGGSKYFTVIIIINMNKRLKPL